MGVGEGILMGVGVESGEVVGRIGEEMKVDELGDQTRAIGRYLARRSLFGIVNECN